MFIEDITIKKKFTFWIRSLKPCSSLSLLPLVDELLIKRPKHVWPNFSESVKGLQFFDIGSLKILKEYRKIKKNKIKQ